VSDVRWFHRQPTLLPGRAVAPDRLYLVLSALGGLFTTAALVMYGLYVVRDAGLSPFQLVIVGTALEGSAFVFEIPTGVVADALSRRLSVAVGYAVVGCGFMLMGAQAAFWAVLAGQFVFGLGWTFISGAREAWLADEIGETEAARLYPRAARWQLAATIAGTLAGGALALLSVRLSLLAGGAAESSLALLVAFTMPERGYTPVPRGERSSWHAARDTALDGVRAARRRPVLLTALAIAALFGMASESFDRLWPYHLLKGGFAVPGRVGEVLLFAGIQLVAQIGGIVAIRLAERGTDFARGESVVRRLFAMNAVIVAGMIAFGLAPTFAVALAAYWIVRWARQAEPPFFTAWVNRGLDPRTRATVLSTVSQADALGQVAGGPAFGVLASVATVRAALVAAAGVLAPTLPVYLRHRRPAPGAAAEEEAERAGADA
jgi:hypothetical protein